eukprot:gene12588-22223_t
MQQISHPHIVSLEDFILDTAWRDVHLVMPFIPHTVEGLLSRQRLNPAHKQWFAAQLLDAL